MKEVLRICDTIIFSSPAEWIRIKGEIDAFYVNESIERKLLIISGLKNISNIKKFKADNKYNISILYRFPQNLKFLNNILLFCYFNLFKKHKKIKNLHIHSNEIMNMLEYVNGKNIIYDTHGLASQEYEYLNGPNNVKQINYLKNLQLNGFNIASKIICVSNNYKKFLTDVYHIKDKHIESLPCCYDDSKFYFDNSLRNSVRSDLKIEDKLVFIYAGSLYGWQNTDLMIDFFIKIKTKISNAYFILLTGQTEEANTRLKLNLKSDSYLVKSVSHDKVNKFLNASDFGFLFRDNLSLNVVSSPTKFAEYMAAGLKAIVTDYVGDYSKMVKENDLGFVYSDETEFKMSSLKPDYDKKKIADFATNNLNWSSCTSNINNNIYL